MSSDESKKITKTAGALAAAGAAAMSAYALYRYYAATKKSGDQGGDVVTYANGKTPEDFKGTPFADAALLEKIRVEAIDWAMCNGLVMRSANASNTFVHAPCTLLPAPLPPSAFKGAREVSALFSKMTDKIARHPSYLETVLGEVGKNDEFTGKLLEILKKDRALGEKKQNATLGLFRSDYMLQQAEGPDSKYPAPIFLQVENNTIAASFGCLSAQVARLHKYVASRFADGGGVVDKTYKDKTLPENNADELLAEAMAVAVGAYTRMETKKGTLDDKTVTWVAMLVQEGEANAADQRLLEFTLLKRHGFRMMRVTLRQVAEACQQQDMSGKPLIIDGRHVALVYFRAGYTPRDYTSDIDWKGYECIELSRAIKCPCISYHLAGTKKVQQKLCEPGEVEKWLDAKEAATLRQYFADQYALAEPLDADSQMAVQDAIDHPEKYVLKPQREGGGNNLWMEEMKEALQLKTMTIQERSAYILMRRIMQNSFTSALMRRGKVQVGECEKEVGIYASYLGGADEEYGKVIGHLMRTKLVGVNEGGVASGYAVLDSPVLI